MSQLICPLCGKFVSVRYYDPSGFEDDIMLVQVRGLGRGKGVEIEETYSLLDGGDKHLLDLISDRVAILYNLLYENKGDDEGEDEAEDKEEDVLVDEDEEKEDDGEGGAQNGELLDLVNDALADIYEEKFSDLDEAVEALVGAFLEK